VVEYKGGKNKDETKIRQFASRFKKYLERVQESSRHLMDPNVEVRGNYGLSCCSIRREVTIPSKSTSHPNGHFFGIVIRCYTLCVSG